MSDQEIWEAYTKIDCCLLSMMRLIRHHIPFQEWPENLQAICGINEDLLGTLKTKPEVPKE